MKSIKVIVTLKICETESAYSYIILKDIQKYKKPKDYWRSFNMVCLIKVVFVS